MKQQYASSMMHIAAVLLPECIMPWARTLKQLFVLCMVHNASQKWLCSGKERTHFQMEWKYSDLQTFHVLWPVPVHMCTGTCSVKFSIQEHGLWTNRPWIVDNLLCDSLIHHASQRVHYCTILTQQLMFTRFSCLQPVCETALQMASCS